MRYKQPTGMPAFTLIWLGQMVSMLGTGMTRFAITIWAWQQTGEATTLALVGVFSYGPTVLMSPIAGALVDRWPRKWAMMISDLFAGLSTIIIFLLLITDYLQIWHLYLAGALAGIFEAFQFPAYSAAVSTMLPKNHYARASGMLSLVESVSQIAAPLLAGVLLALIGLSGILLIDIITFLVSMGALLLVYIPQPAQTEAGRRGQGSLWQESLYGFRYIFSRPSLLGLQLIFLVGNLISSGGFFLLPALILARTRNDEVSLGTVQSALGLGGVVGGVLLSFWGGPRRRIHGLLVSWTLMGLLGQTLVGLGRTPWLWAIGTFFNGFFVPFIDGSNQTIWQAKVAPDVQGRVFAARRLIARSSFPISLLLTGPLADRVFEPAMQPGGWLVPFLGPWVGTGTGAGLAVMFIMIGLLTSLVGLGGYLFPSVRYAEDILPDHDATVDRSAPVMAS